MRRAIDIQLSLYFNDYAIICISIGIGWCRIMGRRQRGSSPMTASLWMIGLSYTGIMRIWHIRLHIHTFFFKSLMIESFILKFSLLHTNLTTHCVEKMCPERRELG